MSVASHCRKSVCRVDPRASLREAAERMKTHRVGLLAVGENGRAAGVVTDRDLVLALANRRRRPEGTRVGDVMTAPAVLVPGEASLPEAVALMRRHGVRRLAVADAQGRAFGVIEADDIVELLANEISGLAGIAAAQFSRVVDPSAPEPVRSRQPGACDHAVAADFVRDVITVRADASLADAAERMKEYSVGCLVVENSTGEAIGMITDRDLVLGAVAPGLDLASTPVSSLMSSPLLSADPGQPLPWVVDAMRVNGLRRIPILKDGRAVGLVSFDDLLVSLGRDLAALGDAASRGRRRERRGVQAEQLQGELDPVADELGPVGSPVVDAAERELGSLRPRPGQD
jgi:CBS domain-containing protein